MSYFSRYQQGEYEEVWAELSALGEQISEEPLHSDAIMVARETMQRARHNIEVLIPRLIQVGFVFGYDHRIQETLRKSQTGADWQVYIDTLLWSREQPPLFLPARLPEIGRAETRKSMAWDGLEDELASLLAGYDVYPDMANNIDIIEGMIGSLPLSLRVWYKEVGAVNFFGYHPRWGNYVKESKDIREQADMFLMDYCDPLQVRVLDGTYIEHIRLRHRSNQLVHFELAPDRHFKNHTAGSSSPLIIRSSKRIDGILDHYRSSPTFVQYLRMCMRWAGFPGMAEWPNVPEDDLAYCTQDLLPF